MLQTSTESPLFVNTLICHRDIERAIVCLHSFALACGNQIGFRFFSDGTVTEEDAAVLKDRFPQSQLIERDELVGAVEPWTKPFPQCRKFSENWVLGFKLIEMPLYCREILGEEHYVYIDSDILFFRILINWRELWKRNVYLRERDAILSGRPSMILRKCAILRDVNSGLISYEMKWHDLKLIEWFLGQDDLCEVHRFLSEQTGWAFLGAAAEAQGATFWQIDPNQIVSSHFFRNLRPGQLALHFISGLKSRVPEFAPHSLGIQTQNSSPGELRFVPVKRLTMARAALASVLNRTNVRPLIFR